MTTTVEEKAESERLVDIRAEQKLLSTLLRESDAWMRLPEGFSPETLASPLNRALYHVIDSIYAKNGHPDPLTVQEALPPDMQKELDKVGGWGFLGTLRELPVDTKNVDNIAQDLIDLHTRRKIESAGEQIGKMASDNRPVQKIIENIELVINDIEGKGDSEVIQIGKGGQEYVENKISHAAEVPGLPSGFPELDKSIQGFQGGRLYVVAAPKKTGKSMILLNWAKHLSIDLGKPILWISTEHSQTDEYSRLLSLVAEVREISISNGTFSDVDVHMDRVEKAVTKLATAPFYFCSMPQFSVTKIKRLTRKFVRVYGVQALFFDYVKAVADTANVREWQELGVLADGLKTLATTENIPVLSAVQINREGRAEWKSGGEMNFDYAAGSDRIGQFMSVGMVLRKPTKKENPDYANYRVLEVTDNRHGPESYSMLLSFQGEIIKLSEVARVQNV
jgi:replicative DNA helicase